MTFTFDQDVTGFEPSDVDVTNANKANNWKSETATTYVLRLTPAGIANGSTGTVTIDVDAGAAEDAAGNGNEAATQASVMVDKERPTATISAPPSGAQNDPFLLTITFNEDVTGFEVGDLQAFGQGTGTQARATAVVMVSESEYTATITPAAGKNGRVRVNVAAGAVTDDAGNDNPASVFTPYIDIDTIAPTATISVPPLGEQNNAFNGAFMLTITFDENVTGFAKEDLMVAGQATATVVSGSGSDYTATITPNANKAGNVTVRVKANTVTDTAGNGNATAVTPAIRIDTMRPTVTITRRVAGTENGAFNLTITFSENVTDFAPEDLTVTGEATATATSGGPKIYTATITPNDNQEGNVTVQVKADAVRDTAQNFNSASVVTRNIPIDTIVPTVESITGVPTTPQKDPFNLTITFSEVVTGFATNDLTVIGHATATRVTGSGTTYTATIRPNTNQKGNVTVQVKVNAVTDVAGNSSLLSAATPEIRIDTVRPTVVIEDVPDTAQSKEVELTVRFDEAVNGFDENDVSLTGPATVTGVQTTGNIGGYYVEISPNDGADGEVTVKINAGVVLDTAGNTNTASTTTERFHVDTRPPTAAFSGVPTTPQKDPFTVTLTFDEPVHYFEIPADLKATLNTMTVALLSGADGHAVYELRVTPRSSIDGSTPESIIIKSFAVEDNAGNENIVEFSTGEIVIDTIVPTVSISGLPTGEQNDAFPLTITFNEDVNGFAAAGLEVTGEATATTVSGGPKVYTATITPNANKEGDVTVQVKEDAVTDAAGNKSPLSDPTSAIHIDTIVPTATISGLPDGEENDAFPLTITFNEDVTGFAAEDLTVTGGVATATAVSGSGSEYTVTISPNDNQEGDVTVQVKVDAVTDDAGNKSLLSDPTSAIHIDTIVPTATISGLPDGEENDAFPLTITFLEDVSGFAAEDLTVTGGVATATAVSGSGSEYTVTISPNDNQEGDVTVQVKVDAVTDDAGNKSPLSDPTSAIHIDTIVPTATISGLPDGEENDAFPLTITFNEDVTGFAAEDLTVTGGVATATAVSGSGSEYTVTISPNDNQEGDVTVQVKVDAVTDDAGNKSLLSDPTSAIHIDTIVPTATISGLPDGEENDAFPLTITFLEDVSGFAAEDLTVTGGVATATAVSGSGSEYTVTISPNDNQEGDVTVQVKVDAVTDDAGNKSLLSDPTSAIHIDTIVPTATISGLPDGEENDAFPLTITFNEDVTGFAAEDLTVTGGVATATAVSGSGSEYTVTISPNDNQEGDVTVQVRADAVTDVAGNSNPVSTATPVIHVDTIVPTATISGLPDGEENDAFPLTITFLEDVSGFAAEDLEVTGEATATAVAPVSGSERNYTATITPNDNQEGDVTVQVRVNAVTDDAGNSNTASAATPDIHIDTIPPTFTIEDTPVLQRRNDFFDIRVVFLEPVNDFRVPGDFTPTLPDLVTPSLQSGADGASEYIVRMTPNENVQGDLIIEIKEKSVQDVARNLNAAPVATTQPVRIDTIAPTVEITDLPTGVKNEAFDVTITFAEVVNGFTTQDIVLVGPATVALIAGTDGDAIYTARVTPNPNAMGNVTLQIPAAVVLDLAENANVASLLTPAIASDTNALTVELQKVPDTVQLGVFSVTIVFSNDVNGFVLGDIEITGDAVVLSSTLLGTGSTYMLNITPDENTDGDVTINVPAGVAQDAGGKSNAASVKQTIAVAPKWIPDTSLRDAFREQLNLGAGTDFTQQQVRAITTIEAEMSGMSNLTGLEQATALTTLVLPGNEITSITPLKQLTKLTSLNLAGNAITDITPLSGLTALTTLNLGGNSLTDISAIKDLTDLTELDLSNNALTDISLLENFTELTTLNLAGNRITDISALTVLMKLTTLNLNDNPIGDFTPLTGLTALTTLELGATGLSSLNAISGLKALTALNLSDNSLTDIALLADLTALTALNLSENTISSLTVLSGLTGLTLLNLNDNAIIDITPLSSLTRLTTLELADNAITSLTSLTVLTLLTRLDLSDNAITDVAPIVGLSEP